MYIRKTCFLSAAALLALTAPGFGEPIAETVVVSATRSAQPLDKTGVSLSVIDESDLVLEQTVFLTDALKEVPGLSINQTGGAGQTTTVYLRGADSGQTATLIDGVRLNDPSDTSTGAFYGDLLAAGIARVEVLRGSQSTLYGSNAIGGVINIRTKRGGDAATTLSGEFGSYDSYRLGAETSGTFGRVEYGASATTYETKGISAADSRNGNSEADGTHDYALTVNTRTHATDTVSVDLRGYFAHSHTEFDDAYASSYPYALADSDAYTTHGLYTGYAGVNAAMLGGKLQNRLALIGTGSTRDYYDSAYDTVHLNYAYSGNALRIEYQGIYDFDPATQIVFGAESERTGFDNDNFYSYMSAEHISGHKRTSGGYGQIQHSFPENLTLTAGVRVEGDQEFGTHASYKVAAAWQLPEWGASLRASFGDGFKAPSLYQLYSAYSNPIADLKAETAKSWEAGFDKDLADGALTFSATYFERRTKNLIDFQSCYSADDADGCAYRLEQYGYYVNVDRAMVKGVELAASAALTDTLKLSANYTYMDAYDRDSDLDLARRPHHMANARLTWSPLDGIDLGASAGVVGKRFSGSSETTRLHTNLTVNLFADYALDETWQLYGRIDNLFDERTETVSEYGRPGISASLGVRTHL